MRRQTLARRPGSSCRAGSGRFFRQHVNEMTVGALAEVVCRLMGLLFLAAGLAGAALLSGCSPRAGTLVGPGGHLEYQYPGVRHERYEPVVFPAEPPATHPALGGARRSDEQILLAR